MAVPDWAKIFPREMPITQGFHNGDAIDLGAPVGTKLFAPVEGRVSILLPAQSYGGGLTIQLHKWRHPQTFFNFCHLSKLVAKPGQHVNRGQLIAYTGGMPGDPNAGHSTGPHLHFGWHPEGVGANPEPGYLHMWHQPRRRR